MVSICIKSNSLHALKTLEQNLDKLTLSEIYYLKRKFKNYYNLIIHYKGNDINKFNNIIVSMLCNFIVINYEKKMLQNQINTEYFYFSNTEKKEIVASAIQYLNKPIHVEEKKFLLNKALNSYLTEGRNFYLEGFTTFRIYEYKEYINNTLCNIINDFIVQKEYIEYVNLLKEYVNQPPQCESIHLIYNNTNKILLDSKGSIITNALNPQIYLSDITFSSNDFILNSLLSLLPGKLYIHSNLSDDNFLSFLKVIFKDRCFICSSCNICLNYEKELKNNL